MEDARNQGKNTRLRTHIFSEKDVSPLGMLTAADRETWAAVWNRLISISPKNREFLDKLCGAMFLVCLDDNKPMNLEETGKVCFLR